MKLGGDLGPGFFGLPHGHHPQAQFPFLREGYEPRALAGARSLPAEWAKVRKGTAFRLQMPDRLPQTLTEELAFEFRERDQICKEELPGCRGQVQSNIKDNHTHPPLAPQFDGGSGINQRTESAIDLSERYGVAALQLIPKSLALRPLLEWLAPLHVLIHKHAHHLKAVLSGIFQQPALL